MLLPGALRIILAATLVAFTAESFAEDYSKLVAHELEKLDLGAHELDITSSGSKVVLDGWVSSDEDKLKILNFARSVDGVGDIKDQIDVAHKITLDDDQAVSSRIQEVKEAVELYMQKSALKGSYVFNYTLDEEGVLIRGSAPPGLKPEILQYSVAREVSTPVRQDIFVRPWPSDSELHQRINDELVKRLGYDLTGVQISVDRGIVTLRGSKPTHEEIDRIATAILMVEGVRDLKN